MIVAKDRFREQWFSSKFARHCDTTTNPEKLPGSPFACRGSEQCKTRSFQDLFLSGAVPFESRACHEPFRFKILAF
jgi:hypothetical protein